MTLLKTLASHWHWRSPYCRYAIRLSLACFVVAALYILANIANGYWALFSVIACVWPTQGASLQRMRQRLLGTFVGMWLGILIAHFVLANAWVIDALLPLFIFLMFYLKAFHYGWFVLFTTIVTMLFVCLLTPGDWHMAFVRMEMTAVGLVIAFLSTVLVLPVYESRQLPRHADRVFGSFKRYFATLCDYYEGRQSQSLPVIQAQSFESLQTALAAVQDSGFEWRRAAKVDSGPDWSVRATAIYEKLLYLDIHMPRDFTCVDMQRLLPVLGNALRAMLPLFDQADDREVFQINRQLAELQGQIKARRINLARDPRQRAANLYELMQLSLFIDTLQGLLMDLPQDGSKPSTKSCALNGRKSSNCSPMPIK